VHGTLSVVYACWPTEGGVAFDGVNDAGTLRGTTLRPRGILRRSHWNALGRCARTADHGHVEIRRELPQSSSRRNAPTPAVTEGRQQWKDEISSKAWLAQR
jgi:hypothetical protein